MLMLDFRFRGCLSSGVVKGYRYEMVMSGLWDSKGCLVGYVVEGVMVRVGSEI